MPWVLEANQEPLPGLRLAEPLGTSGRLWKAIAADGQPRAVRYLLGQVDLLPDAASLDKLRHLRHPYLLALECCVPHEAGLLLVYEWADSHLAAVFRQHRAKGQRGIPRAALLRSLAEVADILDHLRTKQGLQHLRLRPRNIRLVRNAVKLDEVGQAQDWKHLSRLPVAELAYVPPEALENQVSPTSDQYGLAVVYQELLTGILPVHGDATVRGLLEVLLQGRHDLEPLLPAERAVVGKALARNPSERFNSCVAFIEALEKLNAPEPGAAHALPPLAPAQQAVPAPPTATPVSPAATPAPPTATPAVVVASSSPATVLGASPATLFGIATKSSAAPLAALAPSAPPPPPAPVVTRTGDREAPTTPPPAFTPPRAQTRPISGNNPPAPLGERVTPPPRVMVEPAGIEPLTTEPPPPDGVLFPALIVGLGGLGLNVARRLASIIEARCGSLSALPHVRIVGLDTDPGEILQTNSGPQALGRDQVLLLPLQPGAYYQSADFLPPDLTEQLTPDRLSRLHGPDAARGDRVIGRLALLDNYAGVQAWLRRDLSHLTNPDAIKRSAAQLGLEPRRQPLLRAYVVAGLAGGTGGGAHLELARLLQAVLAQVGVGKLEVVGLFLLPPTGGTDRPAQINARLALAELQSTAGTVLFDEVYLQKLPSDKARHDARAQERPIAQAAEFLYRDLLSTLGHTVRAIRPDRRGDQLPCRGFGVTVLASAQAKLLARARRRLAGTMVRRWLAPPPAAEVTAKNEAEGFLQQFNLNTSSLLKRFNTVAAALMGAPPTQIIESWVAPLRKPASARPPLSAIAREVQQQVERLLGEDPITRRPSALSLALQQEAQRVVQEFSGQVMPLLQGFLDRPGMRLAAATTAGRHLLAWIDENLADNARRQQELQTEMRRAERSVVQLAGTDERLVGPAGNVAMGRLKQASMLSQDLYEYPTWCFKEELFARVASVHAELRAQVAAALESFAQGKQHLEELLQLADPPQPVAQGNLVGSESHLLLGDGGTLDEAVTLMLAELTEEDYRRLDEDFENALKRYRVTFAQSCLGQGSHFADLQPVLEEVVSALLEEQMPPADAAAQLLQLPPETQAQRLRDALMAAQPTFSGPTLCVVAAPPTAEGGELLAKIKSTLPKAVTTPTAAMEEIVVYRETGPLHDFA